MKVCNAIKKYIGNSIAYIIHTREEYLLNKHINNKISYEKYIKKLYFNNLEFYKAIKPDVIKIAQRKSINNEDLFYYYYYKYFIYFALYSIITNIVE